MHSLAYLLQLAGLLRDNEFLSPNISCMLAEVTTSSLASYLANVYVGCLLERSVRYPAPGNFIHLA